MVLFKEKCKQDVEDFSVIVNFINVQMSQILSPGSLLVFFINTSRVIFIKFLKNFRCPQLSYRYSDLIGEYTISGYNFFHEDRKDNRKGGGVCICLTLMSYLNDLLHYSS